MNLRETLGDILTYRGHPKGTPYSNIGEPPTYDLGELPSPTSGNPLLT